MEDAFSLKCIFFSKIPNLNNNKIFRKGTCIYPNVPKFVEWQYCSSKEIFYCKVGYKHNFQQNYPTSAYLWFI
jgi:hypothetical protein